MAKPHGLRCSAGTGASDQRRAFRIRLTPPLIASIDTLKRPNRIKRLLEAPRWDLVVFDEAHHLTAYRTGGKVRKTENYKLAEALKGHTRLNWSVMWRLLMRESDFDHFECVASAAV